MLGTIYIGSAAVLKTGENESRHSRYEGKADLYGIEAPLVVDGLERLEECEDEGIAEATE